MVEKTIAETGFMDEPSHDDQGPDRWPGRLVVFSGPDQGASIAVDGPLLTVGTLPENDFVLSDKTVSRRHAEVVEAGGRVIIRDLGSTNGTIVNGRRVKEALLEPGAVIKLGYTQLNYLAGEGKPVAAPADELEFGKICGRSTKMRAIFAMLERIAPTDATIIVQGETGTGKELLARSIHERSSRAAHPFVVFDCRAIAQAMIESELFGSEQGAAAGAAVARAGVFEQARGGTLLLDEVCELHPDVQPKLLRVLEDRQIRRVGGVENIPVDVRIIATSSRDLEAQTAAGRFRKDLFYRLSVHHIVIPPLRERPEDIPLLAAALLNRLSLEYKTGPPPRIAPETLEILKAHDWPGNIRELQNVLSRALSLGPQKVLRPEDLMLHQDGETRSADKTALTDMPLERIEKIAIEQSLSRHDGDLIESAKALGISRSLLLEKLRKYGIS